MGSLHGELLKGKQPAIASPKLPTTFWQNEINSATVAIMAIPSLPRP
jgi:hypothetical protein